MNFVFIIALLEFKQVASHNVTEIQFRIIYNCKNKFGIIYISETYLNSEILLSNCNFKTHTINFVRAILIPINVHLGPY